MTPKQAPKLKSKRLNKAVDDFANEMKKRLAQKEAEGYRGWNDEDVISTNELLSSARKDVIGMEGRYEQFTTPVDVANRMMMVHYRAKKKGAKAQP